MALPCDSCLHDIQGCCDYDEPRGKYCVLGSAYKRKPMEQISIFDLLEEQEEEKEEILLKYFDGRGVFYQEKHLVPKDQAGAMRFIREWREANKGKYFFWGIE